MKAGSTFFSYLYGAKKMFAMNDLRYHMFTTKKESSTNLKCLPPTEKSILQHFKRANVQVLYWQAAKEKKKPNLDLSNFGWEIINNKRCPTTGGSIGPAELIKVS